MTDSHVDAPPPEVEDAEEIDDDFLYHLYQGGELLREERVGEAREHLERAFSLKPKNPRGQNLLGLVYFKLGLFDQAVDVYRDLVGRYPDDPTLRVNLAMVQLKAGQLDDAAEQLRAALEAAPDHENAHKYLGLVLMRQGQADEARQHFELAGIRHPERLMGSAQEEAPASVTRQVELERAQDRALAEVAEEGFRELDAKEMPFSSPGPVPGSRPPVHPAGAEGWQTREVGRGSVAQGRSAGDEAARPRFSIREGELRVQVAGQLYVRLGGLGWVEGELKFAAVHKRFGGRDTRHLFDRGERALCSVEGAGQLGYRRMAGQVFSRVQVDEPPAYFREDLVFAFGDTTAWENGRLTSERNGDLPIFHLFGASEVVLALPSALSRRRLDGSRPLRLHADLLVGWMGNLVPRLLEGEAPMPAGLWIEWTGQGEVLHL